MFARYLIISAGLAIAAPLAAESPDVENPPQIVVAYGDLDLTRQADVEELNRRINRAANRVCPFENSKMALSRLLVAKKCVSEAIERTSQKVAQAVESANDRGDRQHLAARPDR
ncbi:MAG: UrcA family protein [Verrucomicrobiae bacterium]|nr:UrcA family protein [Verrucomicrobiae bacterium]